LRQQNETRFGFSADGKSEEKILRSKPKSGAQGLPQLSLYVRCSRRFAVLRHTSQVPSLKIPVLTLPDGFELPQNSVGFSDTITLKGVKDRHGAPPENFRPRELSFFGCVDCTVMMRNHCNLQGGIVHSGVVFCTDDFCQQNHWSGGVFPNMKPGLVRGLIPVV